MKLPIGSRFTMLETVPRKNDAGRIVSNYLENFNYTVTEHNVDFVSALVAKGQAVAGDLRAEKTARATASGRATVR